MPPKFVTVRRIIGAYKKPYISQGKMMSSVLDLLFLNFQGTFKKTLLVDFSIIVQIFFRVSGAQKV